MTFEDIASLQEWFDENYTCHIEPYVFQNFSTASQEHQLNFMEQHLFFTKKIIEDAAISNSGKQGYLLDSLSYGKSKIVIIEGSRGGGKTATSFWIVNELHEKNLHQKFYFVKTGEKPKGLPDWIVHVQDMDEVPNNSLCIVDESAIKYNSRNSWSDENKDFVKRLVILRHKGISIIMITQHMKMIEIGARRLADIKIYKLGSNLTNEDERADDEKRLVRERLRPRDKTECLVEIPIFNKFYKFTHGLPTWFNDTLSRSFVDFNPEEQTKKTKREKFEAVKETFRMKKEIELAKIEKMKELGINVNEPRSKTKLVHAAADGDYI